MSERKLFISTLLRNLAALVLLFLMLFPDALACGGYEPFELMQIDAEAL